MKRIGDLGLLNMGAKGSPLPEGRKSVVNILALGDVGMTMLIGLRLLGSETIEKIGICDINRENLFRLEMEINQINYPGINEDEPTLPPVEIIDESSLFDGDVFVFCASKSVPDLGAQGDVRMAQLDANRHIVHHFATLAKAAHYQGMVSIVSDPVDPLCIAFLDESGLKPWQIQGFGLGVMNTRAAYFAAKDKRFASYLTEGRAYGPHGKDLVVANSIASYDDEISRELTCSAIGANLRVRDFGYKPYIAPALSSAAISLLLTLEGKWHYSSLFIGDCNRGAFLGMKNKMKADGPEYEDLPLPDELFNRIKKAYDNLCNIR